MIERMWAVDVEGSGASPLEIVELALVEMVGLRLTGLVLHWLFRPRSRITPMASRIHGIRDEDVSDAPFVEDAIDELMLRLEDAPIVGHNVRVEVDALASVLPDYRPSAAYDTLRLARRLLPEQPRHGLEFLGTALGLESAASAAAGGGGPHSARYDAAIAGMLLGRLIEPLAPERRCAEMLAADVMRGQQGRLL